MKLQLFYPYAAYIPSEIAGINPFNYLTVLKFIFGAAVVRKFTVNTIHPSG